MTDEMKALAKALAMAQGEIARAHKDKKNPHFGSKYADLASVWDAWQEVGPKNGLSIVQLVHMTDRQGVELETMLMHSDGGVISSRGFFPSVKNDAQGYGSALTYARRYMLAAMVGVCPDDDDGNASTAQPAPSRKPKEDQEAYASKVKEAFAKYFQDRDKLAILQNEAAKHGLGALAATIGERVATLSGGQQ